VVPVPVRREIRPLDGFPILLTAQRLPVHPATLGGGLAHQPLRHQRDRQHARRCLGILCRRRNPKLTRRQTRSRDRNRHQNVRASMERNRGGEPKALPRDPQTKAVGISGRKKLDTGSQPSLLNILVLHVFWLSYRRVGGRIVRKRRFIAHRAVG
jgi:hypothetical protein